MKYSATQPLPSQFPCYPRYFFTNEPELEGPTTQRDFSKSDTAQAWHFLSASNKAPSPKKTQCSQQWCQNPTWPGPKNVGPTAPIQWPPNLPNHFIQAKKYFLVLFKVLKVKIPINLSTFLVCSSLWTWKIAFSPKKKVKFQKKRKIGEILGKWQKGEDLGFRYFKCLMGLFSWRSV